jgi:hypothetical protein
VQHLLGLFDGCPSQFDVVHVDFVIVEQTLVDHLHRDLQERLQVFHPDRNGLPTLNIDVLVLLKVQEAFNNKKIKVFFESPIKVSYEWMTLIPDQESCVWV